ncbi:MAG: diphosphomevalonate decarboxylase [Thiotrichales bacterium]|nr:diphosphomevalonate decarboxylase [Thiotrichales bacterium]
MPALTNQQQHFIAQILQSSANPQPLNPIHPDGLGSAAVNIALAKYWGKRDAELNLPINGSVSIALPGLGTDTKIQLLPDGNEDQVFLNGHQLCGQSAFARRVSAFLDGFRIHPQRVFRVDTRNSVPTAAGLASSASGYAALVLALDALFGWQLPPSKLSMLARFGSGSASRSLYNGFAIWHRGEREDGLDSYAEAIDSYWPAFCVGLVKIDLHEKAVGSTAGMQQTVATCDLYQSWPQQAQRDLTTLCQAIHQQDFSTLGQTAEHNALSMHATMIATWPPILYWQPESVAAMQLVWQLRAQGIEVYFTMDAGPNLKLLLQHKDCNAVAQAFLEKGIPVEFIWPFATQAEKN